MDMNEVLPTRRMSDAQFSPDEIEQIRVWVEGDDSVPKCPRCGRVMVSNPSLANPQDQGVLLLRCSTCRRFATLREPGERSAPGIENTLSPA